MTPSMYCEKHPKKGSIDTGESSKSYHKNICGKYIGELIDGL